VVYHGCGGKVCMLAVSHLNENHPAPGLAAALVRSLFCGLRPGEKRVAVYVAFSDEATIADADGEFLVAGYVASEETWPWIAAAWQDRVLDGSPPIPYLHMTDIRSTAWRQKHSISYHEAENRVAEAVRILYGTGSLTAMASVIKKKDMREIVHSRYPNKKDIPIGFEEPDYLCYMAYIAIMLIRVSAIYPDATRVNFIVSRKNKQITKGLNAVIEVTKLSMNEHRPDLAPLLGDLIPASPELQLPLQAADVMCWHLQRYYSRSFHRTEENRMWYLLKERDGAIHDWDRDELEALF
jgi:hypothetical protein